MATNHKIYTKRYRVKHKIKTKQTRQYRKNYYILHKDPYKGIKFKDLNLLELIKTIQQWL